MVETRTAELPTSFYEELDRDRFRPTALTRGPWSPAHQHGGPPAGLLARAVERALGQDLHELFPARFSLELVRPVPVAGDLRLEMTSERPGRTVRYVNASLLVAGEERLLARARVLWIRRSTLSLEPLTPDVPQPAGPGETPEFVFPFFAETIGYHRAMELRWAGAPFGTGRATAWMRMRVPLLVGEEPSPFQRVVVAADSGNGVSVGLDLTRYTFLNPELTVHLHRLPLGEWVCLDARTLAQPNGVGLAEVRLLDERGPIGRGAQCLVVAER